MEIKRVSAISGVERVRDIPVNPDDYISWKNGEVSIYDAMPYLNEDDRTFILAGITNDEWKKAFQSEISNIVNDTF